MNILHIYKDYYPVLGGIENHLRVLSEGLVARGHRVTVLVTSRTPQTEVIEQGRLRILKAGRLLHLASTPLSLSMLSLARREAADLVHLQFPYPPGDLAYFVRGLRTPLVISYQSDIVRQQTLLRFYRPLRELTLRRATRIIASSAPYVSSSEVLRRFRHKCVVVPLSTDIARFAQPNPAHVAELRTRYGGPLVLFVGRLRYYKGLHLLLEAMTTVPANLLLVGTGPEEERLRQQAQALGLAERVFFAGDIGDDALPDYYHAADLFVLPAHLRAEAFGIVQLEAMAAGLPLVSTELGTGTSYVNQHGVNGLVVEAGNPQALARALQVLVANPELRARLGARGRQRTHSEFSHDVMVERIESIYQEVVEEQR